MNTEEPTLVPCFFCDGMIDTNKAEHCPKCGESIFEEPSDFQTLLARVVNQIVDMNYEGDLSDLGNEIGIAIGEYHKLFKKPFDIQDFIHGVKHGISLTDGTH